MYRGRLIPGDHLYGVAARPDGFAPIRQTPLSATADSIGKRIACVLVADFAIAAVARANPELREQPFALIRMPFARPARNSGPGHKSMQYQPHSELSCVSPAARAAGLRPGMTVAQARAMLPDLIVTRPSSAAERSANEALLDVAESVSPIVEQGVPGCVWIDLTGLNRLYRPATGSDDPVETENSIAEELIRRTRRLGLDAAAGISSSKEIAQLAARCGGVRIIAPRMEREFLDWLPLELVEFDPQGHNDKIELMLKRLGIRRLGDIARLDIQAIGSRFGSHGVELARLARGEGSATVIARTRGETFVEAAEFDYGIENLEPLGFVLHGMLKQLAERLQIRGFAAGDMTLSLGLTSHQHDERRVAVAAATTEVRSLMTLLKLSLEASPPPAAVETVRLMVAARIPRPAQNDLFLPPSPAPDRLEAAIARIAALCGPERVGTLMPADSYRPEAVTLGKFAPPLALPEPRTAKAGQIERELSNSACAQDSPGSDMAPMVLRTIRPAEEVEVMGTRDTPEFVRGKNICARVVSAAGPWRRQGEWWARGGATTMASTSASLHAQPPVTYARDYYEVALADGAVYRIYYDLYSGKWFADGIYD
jgi:protein ImuB